MSNLIPMDEAARILGMTVEQVTELRSNNEIFGYKDGANWKFKMSELERVAGEMDIKLNMSEAANVASDLSESFGFDLSESSGLLMDEDSGAELIEDLDSAEYIEDSSVELEQPDPQSIRLENEADSIDLDSSDLRLADSGILDKQASDTAKTSGSDVDSESVLDDDDEELSFGSSSLSLASDSRKLTDEDSMKLVGDSKKMSESDMLLSGDDDLSMPEDDFTFGDDSGSFEESAEMSSDFEDSGALILDDSDSSNEITLEPNESGINLSASSSGLSLDDGSSLDLGASDIDALDLPDDSEEIVVLDDAGDAPVMLEEDDFNLTPLENSMDDDDSSGSQVIALEDSEIYADDSAATVLGDSSFGEPVGSEAGFGDDSSFGAFQDPSQAMVPAGAAAAGAIGAGAVLDEAPYTLWQILSLGGTLFLMLAGSMVAYNLAQNLWLPSDQVVGDSVLTFFLNMVGGKT
jgi:hypothetical protein